MSEAGSTFTDWQQVERDSLLFVDDDFNWSEPPRRRRRRITESAGSSRRRSADEPVYDEQPVHAERRAAVLEYEPEPLDAYAKSSATASSWEHQATAPNHFDEMMQQWNIAYGDGAGRDTGERGRHAAADEARRTVLITGHGDERYLPAPRRRRSSELRFHERSSFSPDRAGLWAVLLGIALVIGCIAH